MARPVERDGLRTAFGKQPAPGPVHAGHQGLEGDAQADRRYHGGPEMAALAYSADHYPAWRVELDWPALPLGGFGENLSVSGASEQSVCIGDVWRAGSAVLQIASPRKPCHKISAYWGRPDLLLLVQQSGRSGWYLRVLEEGGLSAGDAIELVDRPHPQWSVARANLAALQRKSEAARELAEVFALSGRWKAWLLGHPARI